MDGRTRKVPGGMRGRAVTSAPPLSLTRRTLLAISAAGGLGALSLLAGCALEEKGGTGGDAPSRIEGAVQVAALPGDAVSWTVEAPDTLNSANFAHISAPIVADGRVYVASGSTLYAFDAASGEKLFETALCDEGEVEEECMYLVSAGGFVIALSCDGVARAVSPDTGGIAWQIEAAPPVPDLYERYEKGVRSTSDGRGSWYVTPPAVHDDIVCVGFSSYEVSPGSYLAAVAASDGSVVWRRDFESRYAFDGGCACPVATAHGLLMSAPQEPCLVLHAYGTGEELARVELDGLTGMAPARVPGDAEHFLLQTQAGTLYEVEAGEGSLAVTGSLMPEGVDMGVEPVLRADVPPLVAGGKAYCNMPHAESQEAPSMLACIDVERFEQVSTLGDARFDTLPVLLQSEETGEAAAYAFRRDGLWRAAWEDGLGEFELVSDEVALGKGGMAVADDGTLFVSTREALSAFRP